MQDTKKKGIFYSLLRIKCFSLQEVVKCLEQSIGAGSEEYGAERELPSPVLVVNVIHATCGWALAYNRNSLSLIINLSCLISSSQSITANICCISLTKSHAAVVENISVWWDTVFLAEYSILECVSALHLYPIIVPNICDWQNESILYLT